MLVQHFLPDGAPDAYGQARSSRARGPAAWPGNVRELRNVIASASAVANGRAIDTEHLPRLASSKGEAPAHTADPLAGGSLSLKEVERRAILEALERAGGNRSRAARMLEIDRSTLRRKLAEFEIEPKQGS